MVRLPIREHKTANGGAIRSVENLTIEQSHISGNQTNGISFGGGIFAGGTGELVVKNSTISGNTSYSGGALINYSSAGVIVDNSTLSGNIETGYTGGAIFNQGPLTINHSTITNNTSDFGNGGGIFSRSGHPININNSIVAGNSNGAGGDSNFQVNSGGTTTGSYNVIGPATTGLTLTNGVDGNQLGVLNENLGPLQFNGGPIQTHSLLFGSAAIDKGDPSPTSPPNNDQRGMPFARIVDGGSGSARLDVGALELQPTFRTFIVTSTANSGPGTLRQAIIDANATTNIFDPDKIEFNIPGPGPHVISLTSGFPTITEPIEIDGTSEPDFAGTPVIQIDGGGTIVDGIRISAGGSTVSGLSITGFTDSGIEFVNAGGNTASGNFLGIDPSGAATPNFFGIRVQVSPNNMIDNNVISGNNRAGVFITGVAASGNSVVNNKIGTDPSGMSSVPNATDGVTIFAPDNIIVGNQISGNARWGVLTSQVHATGNEIFNNQIGVDATGLAPLDNLTGVTLQSGQNLVAENTISGNRAFGVSLSMPGFDRKSNFRQSHRHRRFRHGRRRQRPHRRACNRRV